MSDLLPGGRKPAWTAAEDVKLVAMRMERLTAKEIGAKLGRSPKAVFARCAWLGIMLDGTVNTYAAQRRRDRIKTAVKDWYERHPTGHRSRPQPVVPPDRYPPPDTRDTTAYLMGDPLPGRSALDQRRSA